MGGEAEEILAGDTNTLKEEENGRMDTHQGH